MLMRIVVDIWGGHLSQDFLARYVRDEEIAKTELMRGRLVNLRQDDDPNYHDKPEEKTRPQ